MWMLILSIVSQSPNVPPVSLEAEYLHFTECQEARNRMKLGVATLGDVTLKCEFVKHEAQPL